MRFAAVLALIAGVAGAAGVALQGPVPGDLALTLGLQSLLGTEGAWAAWITATAKAPLLWGTLAGAAALAWRVAGLRAGLAVPLAYGFAFAADKALRAVLFVPRPDPQLVAVAEPAASSGLPSTFGLVYGAVFGVVLLTRSAARRARPARVLAAVLIVAGVATRIVTGGHWGSQMLASLAMGLLMAAAALAVTSRLPLPRRA